MSSIVYNENTRRIAAQRAEKMAHVNELRSALDGATLDGVLEELAYRVGASEDDLEAQSYLIEMHEIIDIALNGMAAAQDLADMEDDESE